MVYKKYKHSPINKYKEHINLYEKKIRGNKYSFGIGGLINTKINIIFWK